MKQSVLFALLAVLAFIAANIPFFNHHVLGIFPRPEGRKKHLYCRLLEFYGGVIECSNQMFSNRRYF